MAHQGNRDLLDELHKVLLYATISIISLKIHFLHSIIYFLTSVFHASRTDNQALKMGYRSTVVKFLKTSR